ncbi:unnamed protein product [Rotaria socialis]|uniref:C2H2-type domain-containing protein n=1 Tax=Rotaria socialis TaxID=392032 RepID=A0A818WBF1_9BILA|nr:unnamed protein product [Rotaria socialis]
MFCKFCTINRSFNKFFDYFRHITLYHANERNFQLTCDISSCCGVVYKTFTSYKMHIHRHHRSLLNPSFQQQENNGIVQLPIQQPDTTHIYPTTIDYTDENVIYSDIDHDILGNQSNMSSTQVSYDDNKVDIIAVQQLYSRFLLEMREQHILPQLVIQSITTYIVNLLDIAVELIEEQAKRGNMIQQQSASTSISVDDVRSTVNQIEKSIILSTRNEYQFLQSCQKYFNYSPPTQNILSSKLISKIIFIPCIY